MPTFDNFAITSTGRSGTKFLSYNMNKSKIWTVAHEPPIVKVLKQFNRDKYGEVNSRLLDHVFASLDVAKKAVILRRPSQVLVSFDNRNNGKEAVRKLKITQHRWYILHSLVTAGVPIIWFHKMVSDVAYLQHVFTYFGVMDVKVTEAMLQEKRNATSKKQRRVTRLQQCSKPVLQLYHEHAKWFEEQYFDRVPENVGYV